MEIHDGYAHTSTEPHITAPPVLVVGLSVRVFLMMRSARQTGATLLLTPVLIIAGILYFPSYDARPGRFVGSFDNIVTAGGRYLVSLILFIVVAVLLGSLSYGLARGDIRDSASAKRSPLMPPKVPE